jgi:hypothetical protein
MALDEPRERRVVRALLSRQHTKRDAREAPLATPASVRQQEP